MWTLDDVLRSAARKFAGREALVGGGRRLSFADLDAAADDAAARLQAAGIAKGDAVAIHGRNTVEWVMAFFGAVRAACPDALMWGWLDDLTTMTTKVADMKRPLEASSAPSAP